MDSQLQKIPLMTDRSIYCKVYEMNLKVWGAPTLTNFTQCISQALASQRVSFDSFEPFKYGLAQIHGSPNSIRDDRLILEETLRVDYPVLFLIHRPDELLENPELMALLDQQMSARFIVLGDLVFSFSYWMDRMSRCTVIPHPFMDLAMPTPSTKPTVGSFTSWGEMRKVEHYLALVNELRPFNKFEFKIGGPGVDRSKLPADVLITSEFYVPHFNVQLYHLNGRKRFGESSGSLHKGISIPIIFEANGAERIEKFHAVKIKANDDLSKIDFASAAQQIANFTELELQEYLQMNYAQAVINSPESFAKNLLSTFSTLG